MRRVPPRGLIAISPGDLTRGTAADFVGLVDDCALDGGLRAVLLREPAWSDRDLLAVLRSLCALRARHDALWVGVHDRPHLALAAGADGVHLGFRSLTPVDARRVVESHCAIGLSTHAGDDPRRATDADWFFHGPVHDTPSKRGLKAPIGYGGLSEFCAASPAPVFAIGGLEPRHATSLRAAGAAGAAVLRGVARSADPVAACADWRAAWATAS